MELRGPWHETSHGRWRECTGTAATGWAYTASEEEATVTRPMVDFTLGTRTPPTEQESARARRPSMEALHGTAEVDG